MFDFELLDSSLKDEVTSMPGGERAENCYLCGTCTAGCPVSIIHKEFNPRKIMRMLLLGMKKELLASPEIWQCSQCHTCVAHCPQDVRFADIIRVLRKMAVNEGFATEKLYKDIEKLDEELKIERVEKVKKITASLKQGVVI